MNLHKNLLIALFAIGAQSINAGILFYDDAEIEAKKPGSYEIDPIAATVTAEFKHNYNTRRNMALLEGCAYILPTLASSFATLGAAAGVIVNYDMLNWQLGYITTDGGLSEHSLKYCRSTLSDLNTCLVALPVAALVACFCWYKIDQNEKKVAKLPKEERVTVASIVQK